MHRSNIENQYNNLDKIDFDNNEKKKKNKKAIFITLIIFIIIGIITGGIFYFLVNQKDKYYLSKTITTSSDISSDEDITNTFETQYNEDGLIVEETKCVLHIGYAFRIVLLDYLLCEILARCAFLFSSHFVHSFFVLSFIVAHSFKNAKVCKLFF